MLHTYNNNSKGFSLIELAVVLTVAALLVVAIIAGKHLIEGSETRAVIAEHEHYQTATEIFLDKYKDLPGDMSDAWDYWGADCAGDAASCNGNGDGLVRNAESLMAWRHLELAELVWEGGLSGEHPPAIGISIPDSKISRAGWHFLSFGVINLLMFGAMNTSLDLNLDPALTPRQAHAIDTKLDDGSPVIVSPNSRVTVSSTGVNLDCFTGCPANIPTYNLDPPFNEEILCSLVFQLNTSTEQMGNPYTCP